jgi:hypothetical protein
MSHMDPYSVISDDYDNLHRNPHVQYHSLSNLSHKVSFCFYGG